MYRIQTLTADADEKLLAKVRGFLDRTGGLRHIDTKVDVITIALDANDDVVGFFAGRPMPLIHEFRMSDDCMKRSVAEALYNYSMGAAFAAGHREALIAVDKSNVAMLKFVGQTKDAVEYSCGEDMVYILKMR